MIEILRTGIRIEHDVFVVRQRGREIARLLGMERQDQVRVATSLSEVGRLMLADAGGAEVVMAVEQGPRAALRVDLAGTAPVPEDVFDRLREPLAPVQRLMEGVDVSHDADSRIIVRMRRALPITGAPVTRESIDRLRVELAHTGPTTPFDELTEQNHQLLVTLEEIQRQRDELLRLNAELEETNRGVMALYNELSDELEETNRGVVALYAELDERTAQLREASEAKSRFLANVSHELRAPVTAIMGLARLLIDPGSDPLTGDQRHQVDLLSSSASDLLSLVNELLDLAKAESGRLEPQFAEVDLRALFGQLRGTLRAIATRPEVALVVTEPAVAVLTTDESMLTQILRNLLTNALKFTEEGEVRLSVAAGDNPSTVRLAVADTGIGIPADERERVFEEFYQVPGAQQAKVRGTGLGLPYARRLATLLGGSLTLASTPGEGSVFTVTLPVRPPVPAAPEPAAPAEPAHDLGQAPLRRVLVVDDDEAFRLLARRAMHGVADEIEEAGDGLRALTLITRQRPDLILLDLRMPEVDGVGVLEILASDEALRDIPVVVVTTDPPQDAPPALRHARAVVGKHELTPQGLAGTVRTVAGGGATG
jgi:signal transduction histidine kinase